MTVVIVLKILSYIFIRRKNAMKIWALLGLFKSFRIGNIIVKKQELSRQIFVFGFQVILLVFKNFFHRYVYITFTFKNKKPLIVYLFELLVSPSTQKHMTIFCKVFKIIVFYIFNRQLFSYNAIIDFYNIS